MVSVKVGHVYCYTAVAGYGGLNENDSGESFDVLYLDFVKLSTEFPILVF